MNYNFIFLWLLIVVIVLRGMQGEFIINKNGYLQMQIKWVWAILAFFPIFYIAVYGIAQGDVSLYIENYKALPENWSDILVYLDNCDNSQLFWLFSAIIKKIFGGDVTAFRFSLALIQSISVIYIFRKYSDSYILSLYIFVASAIPLAWMMNGIRQFLAVTIIFAATPLILRKNYVKLIVIIIIASFIHQTAIIMLPIVFIVRGKAWNRKTIFLIIVSIIAVYIFTNKSGSYEEFMTIAGYSPEAYATDDGVNPLRVLVNFVPVMLAFWGKRIIEIDEVPIINLSINMSIVSFGIYLVSMVTSGILVGRVPIYMSMYNCILLPYLLKKIFNYRSYKLAIGIMIICYGMYYYVQYV